MCIERGGDSVGDAGNCSFIPYDAQLLPLADAVVASHASLCTPHTATASSSSSSFAGAALQDGVAWALLHSHPSRPTHAPPTPDCLAHMPKALLKGFDRFSSGDSESGESEEPAPRLSRRSRASPPIILNLSHIIADASEGVTAAGMEGGEEDMQHMRRSAGYGGVWLASQVCEQLLARLPLAPPAASHAPSASPSHAPSASPTASSSSSASLTGEMPVVSGCGGESEGEQPGAAPGAEVKGSKEGNEAAEGLVIVTAASRNYFGCLKNLVGSVHVWGGHRPGGRVRKVVVYDVGLSGPQRWEISGWRGVEVRKMAWERVTLRSLRLYAWKVEVWVDAVRRYGSMLFIDACSELRGRIHDIEAAVASEGVFMTVGAEATAANIARDSLQLTHSAQVQKLVRLHRAATCSQLPRGVNKKGMSLEQVKRDLSKSTS